MLSVHVNVITFNFNNNKRQINNYDSCWKLAKSSKIKMHYIFKAGILLLPTYIVHSENIHTYSVVYRIFAL